MKRFISFLMLFALCMASIAEARIGGSRSIGMSRSVTRSYSASSRSYSSGSSYRNYSAPSYSRPAPSYTPTYHSPTVVQQHVYHSGSNGPGWGGVAAGALGGYLLGHSTAGNNQQPVIINNGGGAPASAQPQYVDPNAGAQQQQVPQYSQPVEPQPTVPQNTTANSSQDSGSGIGTFLLWLIILAALAAFGIVIFKAWQKSNGLKTSNAKATMENDPNIFSNDDADSLFTELQDINNKKDVTRLNSFCTPEMAKELQDSMGGNTRIINLDSEVIDQTGNVASARYTATIQEEGKHPEEMSEIWHFIRYKGEKQWRLSGIEQYDWI